MVCSRVYACPSDSDGAKQTYPLPPGFIQFQVSYRANAYMFRPAMMKATPGQKNLKLLYRMLEWTYPIGRSLAPSP